MSLKTVNIYFSYGFASILLLDRIHSMSLMIATSTNEKKRKIDMLFLIPLQYFRMLNFDFKQSLPVHVGKRFVMVTV